jgi:ribosome-binding factor A
MKKRIARINELIKKEFSQILLREIDFPREILVTVTRVETTPDLRESKIFISIWPEEKQKNILNNLSKRIYFFQQKINKRLKMKFIPKLIFLSEEKTKEASKIEEILEKLKKEKK